MSGVHQRLLVAGVMIGEISSLPRIPTIQVQDELLERFNDHCALASTTLGSLSDIEGNPRKIPGQRHEAEGGQNCGQMYGQKCAQKEGAQIAFHARRLTQTAF
jgi:hypothetical protein